MKLDSGVESESRPGQDDNSPAGQVNCMDRSTGIKRLAQRPYLNVDSAARITHSEENRVRQSRREDIDPESPWWSGHGLKLEAVIYWLLVITVVACLVAVFHDRGLMVGNKSPVTAIVLAVGIKILSSVRILTGDILPRRIRRRDIGRFLSNEVRFSLAMTFIVFFMTAGLNPVDYGLFLLSNFVLQSILYICWYRYNRVKAEGQDIQPSKEQDKHIIIVGASKRGVRAADLFLDHPDLNIRILGFVDYRRDGLWRYRDIPLLGHPDRIDRIIVRNQVDYVVMAVEPDDLADSQRVFNVVEKMGINICLLPDIYERKISGCRTGAINGQPILMYHSNPDGRTGQYIKEVIDRIGALAGLIILAPVLLLSAIAIKIDSRGPVFFKQVRSGKNGRKFKMIKLRTMHNDADRQKDNLLHLNEMSGPVFKIKNDPRITRVGRFLRKFSIDEFPQFFNILKGDMSLVGPRPPLPDEVVQYEPWQRRKLSVKPGATCLWQINGRNHLDFDKWVKLDMEYIDNWSLKEDTLILIKTVPAVIKGKGAS
jgi:exopolysaccharide biosynthesis polyprenyl glycosylphosphotransferase